MFVSLELLPTHIIVLKIHVMLTRVSLMLLTHSDQRYKYYTSIVHSQIH